MQKIRGIYQRTPGDWWVRYADSTGKIRREKAGARNVAIALYRKRKTEILQGKKLPESLRQRAVLFSELAADTLEFSKAHKLSHRIDGSRMKTLVGWIGTRAADSITPQEIERWQSAQQRDANWKPSTVNRHRSLLSLTYRLALKNGKVTQNPVRLVPMLRENNSRIRWLSQDEETRLREHVPADNVPELDLALATGMRRSEQYNLTWDCVNFEQRMLTIARSKSGDSRHIRLNGSALSALHTLHTRSIERGHYASTGRVFLREDGSAVPMAGVWFKRAIKAAGVDAFRWHDLRHTFVSRLIMSGADLRTAQLAAGHKTIAMTCRYAHLAASHEQAAVDRLDNLFGTDTKTSTSTSKTASDTAPVLQ